MGGIIKVRNTALAGLVSVGLMTTPVVASAVDVKLGSDGGQLVFVPDEGTIKAGDSVSWLGNKGMPHNVVFALNERAKAIGTIFRSESYEPHPKFVSERVPCVNRLRHNH